MNPAIEPLIAPLIRRLQPPLNTLRQLAGHHWQQLSRREQWLLVGALVTLLAWLIWQGVFVTLSERQQQAEQTLRVSEQQLARVRGQAAQIQQLRASGAVHSTTNNQPMDTVVHSLASRYRITIERVGYEGELLSVGLAPARFEDLLQWLAALAQQQGIVVRSLSVQASDTPGVVEVGGIDFERQ